MDFLKAKIQQEFGEYLFILRFSCLISWCEPKHVRLVHGGAAKMDFLKAKIQQEFGEYPFILSHLFFVCVTQHQRSCMLHGLKSFL